MNTILVLKNLNFELKKKEEKQEQFLLGWINLLE